jgi:hypothetical protein
MSSVATQSAAFVHDFATFAGWSGIWAATLFVLGAAFEGVGLLLLVPILSIVTASESSSGWAHTILVQGLATAGAETRTARLSVLLGPAAVILTMLFIFSRISAPAMQMSQTTSAIDGATERKIINRMLELKPRPTIVMIAHREQSLAYCDRIVRCQNGRFVADEPALTA